MTPNAAKKGRSFKGAIAYIIHDPDKAETNERVLFTETRNLRTDDPEKAAKVMAYTVQHAGELKEAAGMKATGRKTHAPVYHFSLSWIPGENPTQNEMMKAGISALEELGFEKHEAVFAAHGDKEHIHLHIVTSRINPETGRTHNPNNDYDTLQAWGHEYDKARGMEHHSPDRAAKYEKDPVKKAEYQLMAAQAREQKGAANSNSKPRAEWEAVAGATYPKSQNYREIKTEYARRVSTLSGEGRELNMRHKEEWTELTAAQRADLKNLAAELRHIYAGEIKDFMKILRQERAEFLEDEKYRTHRLDRNMKITAHTSVGNQGPEHRGNLAHLFNDQGARHIRTAEFWKQHEQKKKDFFKQLELRETLPSAPSPSSSLELRSSFKGSADAQASRYKASYRQERTALLQEHQKEQTLLRDHQKAEKTILQGKWAELNGNRTEAWKAYRERRAEQEKAREGNREEYYSPTHLEREPNRGDPGPDFGGR